MLFSFSKWRLKIDVLMTLVFYLRLQRLGETDRQWTWLLKSGTRKREIGDDSPTFHFKGRPGDFSLPSCRPPCNFLVLCFHKIYAVIFANPIKQQQRHSSLLQNTTTAFNLSLGELTMSMPITLLLAPKHACRDWMACCVSALEDERLVHRCQIVEGAVWSCAFFECVSLAAMSMMPCHGLLLSSSVDVAITSCLPSNIVYPLYRIHRNHQNGRRQQQQPSPSCGGNTYCPDGHARGTRKSSSIKNLVDTGTPNTL